MSSEQVTFDEKVAMRSLSLRTFIGKQFNSLIIISSLFHVIFPKPGSSIKKVKQKLTENGLQMLFNLGLLRKSSRQCKNCAKPLRLQVKNESIDGYVWKCSQCYKDTESIRAVSIFSGSPLSFFQLLTLVFLWTQKSKAKDIKQAIGISNKTITSWVDY